MNNDNTKKGRELSEEDVKNVSGGYVSKGMFDNEFDVHDNITRKTVFNDLNAWDADKLNSQYNYANEVMSNASRFDGVDPSFRAYYNRTKK